MPDQVLAWLSEGRAGLMLVDFPGKRVLEQKLVARRGVLETMNRVRAWLGRPPLVR